MCLLVQEFNCKNCEHFRNKCKLVLPSSPSPLEHEVPIAQADGSSCPFPVFLGSKAIIYIFKCFGESQIYQVDKSKKQLRCLQGRKDPYIYKTTTQTKQLLSINLKAIFRQMRRDNGNEKQQIWVPDLALPLIGSMVEKNQSFLVLVFSLLK